MSAAEDVGFGPEDEDALWDRLVEGRRADPRRSDRRPPSPSPAVAGADGGPGGAGDLTELIRAVASLAGTVERLRQDVREMAGLSGMVDGLREDVEFLTERIDEMHVQLDPDQVATLLKQLLEGMTFDTPAMAGDQKINLRLRLRPSKG